MRRNKTHGTHNQLRTLLVKEAARLMYEEGVSQYFDAKHLAAKRMLGRGQGKRMRYRPKDLPSNGEIANELQLMARFHEGDQNRIQLFHMRATALQVMEQLNEFSPRLIGSVSTGRVRKGSDIDLHLFCNSIESIEARLNQLDWPFETKLVCIHNNSRITEYTHIYLQREFPIELSIYPEHEIRVRGRSSTDGKPIIRLSPDKLIQLLITEHGDAWNRYLNDGEQGSD